VQTILSIQSAVAYGHVGNSAAVFPLQRLGHEVWPVYTVNFSNHTGYGAWRGPLIPPDDVREVVTGIEERGALAEVDLVLSGYQGSEGIGEVVLDAVDRVKKANPNARYACDPVAALEQTTGAVFGLLQATLESGRRELQLVPAQEEYVAPSHTFTARRVR
jgi:pyridoxal kinase